MVLEEDVNMAKEEEIVTIVIIMKEVINPLEVMKEEQVEIILEEEMKGGMINLTLYVSILPKVWSFFMGVHVKPILNAIIAISIYGHFSWKCKSNVEEKVNFVDKKEVKGNVSFGDSSKVQKDQGCLLYF